MAPTTTVDTTPATVVLYFLELFPVRANANQLAIFEQSIRDQVEAAGVDVSLFTPSPIAVAQTGRLLGCMHGAHVAQHVAQAAWLMAWVSTQDWQTSLWPVTLPRYTC